MKIGFSSLVCPTWDLATIVANAAKFGFDGVELRGLRGELHLPLVPELAGRPEGVRRLLAEHKIELVCLGSSATLASRERREAVRQKAVIAEFVELAAALGCPHVRVYVGDVGRRDDQRAALSRAAEALISLVPILVRWGVTLLVENGGDFAGSADLWFLIDAVEHPAVRCCWNQCNAMALGERPTNSLPRLGHKIAMIHLCDGEFDADGVLLDYKRLGEGHAEVSRQIELLRGLVYDRYLIFEWPKLWVDSLPAAEEVLPAVANFLRANLDAKQPVLSAYKGDKYAPRMASRPTAPSPT